MPSPFPGMDPYLEHPAIFPGLHDRMVTYLGELLQAQLPEPYFAEIGDRLWVEMARRTIGPDISVAREDSPSALRCQFASGEAATAGHSVPVVVTVPHDEYREPFLQIYSQIEGERLVTVIEVLSLSNKTGGARGRDLYLKKQREVLDSQTHLVEIDLLRGGEHTTAVPLDRALEKAGHFDYHVCIHRFDRFEDYLVYPIHLAQRLPRIAIPLLPGDGDVSVDLQTVFDRSYDTGPYQRRIRYRDTAPQPPLSPDQSRWAATLLG